MSYLCSMLIFLDIDGVMVPAKSWESPELLYDGFPKFSIKATKVLQSLISLGDVSVMLTTSHRTRFTVEKWKDIFQRRGITVNRLEKLDNPTIGLSRKDEIVNWFSTNVEIHDFIIIDDDKSLNALPSSLKENLILTNSLVGLTDSHIEEINSIRNKPQLV
jgi:hypothetical protein